MEDEHKSVSSAGSSESEVELPPVPVELFYLVSKYVDWPNVDHIDMSMNIQKYITELLGQLVVHALSPYTSVLLRSFVV